MFQNYLLKMYGTKINCNFLNNKCVNIHWPQIPDEQMLDVPKQGNTCLGYMHSITTNLTKKVFSYFKSAAIKSDYLFGSLKFLLLILCYVYIST